MGQRLAGKTMKFVLTLKREALPFLLQLFKTWSFLFIVFVLPLYLIYKLDSLVLALKPFEILVNSSVMLIFFLILSVFIALLSWIATIFFWPWRVRILQANVVAAWTLALCEVLRTMMLWLESALDIDFGVSVANRGLCATAAFSILLILLFMCRRGSFYGRIERAAFSCFRPILSLSLAALLLSLSWAVTHYPKAGCAACDQFATSAAVTNSKFEPSSKERPNIILLTFDALAAKDMSVYGCIRQTTPNIDSLSGESYVFDNMYANSNWTRPSVASVMTGMYPNEHRLTHYLYGDIFLKDEKRTLPWMLREHGYCTVAVVNNTNYAHPYAGGTFRSFDYCPWVTSPGMLRSGRITAKVNAYYRSWLSTLGLEAHLWVYDWSIPLLKLFRKSNKTAVESPYPIDFTIDIAKKMLKSGSTAKFLWIHLLEPHAPYAPPKPFKYSLIQEEVVNPGRPVGSGADLQLIYAPEKQDLADKLRLRYQEYIRYADYETGRFIQYLKDSGEWDKTIFVLSADHGESFEDCLIGHGGDLLYNQLIHIPLIVHLPGMREGKRVGSNAEGVDIAPTILDLVGMKTPGWMEGESLKDAMLNGRESGKPKFSMQLATAGRYGPLRSGTAAVMEGGYKLIMDIHTRKVELYDLAKDPKEDSDLSKQDEETTRKLTWRIDELIRRSR